jgi:serine/threonine protein kinase
MPGKTQNRSKREKRKRKTKRLQYEEIQDIEQFYSPKSSPQDIEQFYTPISSPQAIHVNRIGSGTFGNVFRPNIPCPGIMSSTNLVSKILPTSTAIKEKRNFDLLPDDLDGQLYYKYSVICPLPEKYSDLARNSSIPNSNLTIAYIEGIEFEKYLNNFKNIDNQTSEWNPNYENRNIIPRIELFEAIQILQAYYTIYPLLHRMNVEFGIYHNDISTTNMIYNDKTNKILLVDFGMITRIDTNLDYINSDSNQYINGFISIFGCLYYNEEIRDYIKDEFPTIFTGKLNLDSLSTICNKLIKYKTTNRDEYETHFMIFLDFIDEVIQKLRRL